MIIPWCFSITHPRVQLNNHTAPQRVPHRTTDHHATANVTLKHDEHVNQPWIFCHQCYSRLPDVAVQSHTRLFQGYSHCHKTLHDPHRQPFQITTLHSQRKMGHFHVCQFIVTVAASNQGIHEEIEIHEHASLLKSIRFSGNRRENGAQGQRSLPVTKERKE
jgi:hypothetical protein